MTSLATITLKPAYERQLRRRRRYAALMRLLNEWADDPSDFDERVAPLIDDALKEAAPRHFRKP